MSRFILYRFIIVFFFVFNTHKGFAQDSVAVNISNATIKSKYIEIDLSNPQELELALRKIHTFKYIESITLQGEGEETDLKKLLYRLSALKNLTNLTFDDNNLPKMPENISGLKELHSLTISGNESLDYTDLCEQLKTLPLDEIHFIDNDWTKPPASISKIATLKKVEVSGSTRLHYEELIEQLTSLPQLSTLVIPVNFMPDLPKNITKLRNLKVLDVSNNVLTELPSEISALKAINDLSIQGNLLLNPVKDLEKLKDAPIEFLSLDKEISGEEVEQIKKMFPNAEISFPVNPDEDENAETEKEKETQAEIKVSTGSLKATKQLTVLSPAYRYYPSLFRNITYNFDTLFFEERYANFKYHNTSEVTRLRSSFFDTYFYFSSYDNKIRSPKKKICFYIPSNLVTYPELRAFSGMYWVYDGPLSRRQFKRKYLYKPQLVAALKLYKLPGIFTDFTINPIHWNDVRIQYDKNNSLYTIEVKTDSLFEKFSAYPVSPSQSIEKNQRTYTRRFTAYQKALMRRSKNFNRDLAKEKRLYDNNYKEMRTNAWKTLQTRMSNEERLMSMEEWLEYYDALIADEYKILGKSSLNSEFVLRALDLKNYLPTRLNNRSNSPRTINVNTKFSVNFINATSKGKLAVAAFCVIDNRTKQISQYTGNMGISPETVFARPFASNVIIVELRNGDFGVVSSKQIDALQIDPSKTYDLEVTLFDKNLDTIETLLKAAEIH